MKRKLSKSILATGLAAASFVVGANHVQADSLEDKSLEKKEENSDSLSKLKSSTEVNVDKTIEESSETKQVQTEEVTAELVQFAKEKVEESQSQLKEQTNVTTEVKTQLDNATNAVEQAQKEVDQKKQDVEDATPENISKAEATKETLEQAKSARQEDVEQARQAETVAANEVKKQETAVNAAQTLVDMAKTEVAKAEEPIKFEKEAVEAAKATVQKASEDVTAKEQEVKRAEQLSVNRNQSIAQAQQKVTGVQKELSDADAAIARKETELKNTPATPVSQSYSYTNFLDYLQTQVTNPAYANLANQAKAEYQKHSSINTANATSYENALAAVRILRGVNAARKAAGLPELYINPFLNYESHIQAEASRSRIASGNLANVHTGLYNYNENLAWGYAGFGPESAVNIWQSEKAAYQALARQRNLPTNETQLDANDLYVKLGGAAFSPVGHYLQNMSNKFNVATTAFVSTGSVSQISFKSVGNLQELIQAGVVMTVDQYEAKLREFAAGARSGVGSAASKLQAELNVLKAQRTGIQSRLNIANAELNDLKASKSTDAATITQAKTSLETARTMLSQAQTKLTQQENTYENAYKRIAATVAPLQGVLKSKEADLAEAKVVLARLEQAHVAAQSKTKEAEAKLADAEKELAAVVQRISDLKNAPENLKQATAVLEAAQKHKDELETKYQTELEKLEGLKAAHAKLEATYQDLLAKYNLLHPENQTGQQHPGITAVEGLSYHGKPRDTRAPMAQKGNKTILPSTGTNQNDALLLAGMLLGAASLAAGAKKKKED